MDYSSNGDSYSLEDAARLLALPVDRMDHVMRERKLKGTTIAADEVRHLAAQCHGCLHHHAVQFFEDEQYLVDVVCSYAAEGLASGAPVVFVARPERLALFLERLRVDGLAPEARVASGQLTCLDAHTTLSRFMVGGLPDAVRFEATVGPAMDAARERFPHVRLRAYGEMVDILCAKGQADAALTLEAHWNALAERKPFALLCGYSMARFDTAESAAAFARVCELHSDVTPAETRVHTDGPDAGRREISRLQQRLHMLEKSPTPQHGAATAHAAPGEPLLTDGKKRRSDGEAVLQVLIVDGDDVSRRATLQLLGSGKLSHLHCEAVTNSNEALQAIEQEHPDICLTVAELQDGQTALDLYRMSRARGQHSAFVCIASSAQRERLTEVLLGAGFEDVIDRNAVSRGALHAALHRAALRNRHIRHLIEHGTVDELTGAFNRRGLLERLHIECARGERLGTLLSLLYLDLNNMKAVNDNHGHSTGDELLRALTRVASGTLRKCDVLGRLGGDEFVIVLPGTGAPAALRIAERIRERLAQTTIPAKQGWVTPSVSIGLHTAQSPRTEDADSLLAKADAAMFREKQAFRTQQAEDPKQHKARKPTARKR